MYNYFAVVIDLDRVSTWLASTHLLFTKGSDMLNKTLRVQKTVRPIKSTNRMPVKMYCNQ